MTRKHFPVKCGITAILAVILAVCLTWGLILSIPKLSFADGEENFSVWDGNLIKAGWGTEGGEKPTDYVVDDTAKTVSIGSAAAFAYFAHEVSLEENDGFEGYTVSLECNIDLGGDNNIWIPIGTTERSSSSKGRFKGTFDGKGKTISNMSSKGFYDNMKQNTNDGYFIECISDESNYNLKVPFGVKGNEEYCFGLFASTAFATIKDLSLTDIKIDMPLKEGLGKSGLVTDGVGAIVGYSVGSLTMLNCTTGSENDDSYIKNTACTGGLVGRAYAYNADGTTTLTPDNPKIILIENCVNYIELGSENEGEKKGGIIGFAQYFDECIIRDCINYGNINGGLYGAGIITHFMGSTANLGDITVSNCINKGEINASGYTGGIVGLLQFGQLDKFKLGTVRVKECINFGKINSSSSVGGIVGWTQSYDGQDVGIIDCFNYGDVTGSGVNVGGILGWLNVSKQLKISGGNSGNISSGYPCVGNGVVCDISYFVNTNANTSTSAEPAGKVEYDGEIEFIYDENDNTVIKGIKNIPEQNFAVTIPANVKKIGFGAFAGLNNLVEVDFAENGALTAIEDWAFAGTGIGEINVPAQVAKIGASAFGGCASLSNAVLSEGLTELGQSAFGNTPALHKVHVTAGSLPAFGKNVFDKGVYVIAENREHYDSLFEKNGTDYAEQLTFVVTIEYDYYGTILDTEYRLFNKSYAVQLNEETGEWIENPNPSLGTAVTGVRLWYASNEGDYGEVLSVNDVHELLKDCGDVLSFYTFNTNIVFVARENIVYDGTEYGRGELNSLLTAASTPISPDMTVEIIAYTDADGVEATVLPNVIKNAGEYTVQVTVEEVNYSFNVTIGRATVDLADYNVLAWKLTQIGTAALNNELRDGTGLILYIYKDNDGNEYPATSVLTEEQITELGLTGAYTTRTVLYSAVRNRNSDVTITITANDAFSVEYEGNTGKAVGAYQAIASITADANYTLSSGSVSSLRGIKIEVAADGRTAEVTKHWYIVDLSNWLTNVTSENYSHAYRDNSFTNATVPETYYTSADGQSHMTLRLFRGTEQIGQEFGPDEINSYITRLMPAGEYRLEVTVEGIISHEYDEADIEQENPIEVYHGGFTESVNFTVTKSNLPQTAVAALNSAIKGKTFTYIMDGSNHLFDGTAKTAVETFLATPANESLTGTVWAGTAYEGYYDSFVIEYNLLRMQSDNYSANINTNETGLYTVYYRISAPNYYSSLENLGVNEKRQDYCFYVVNVEEVEIPVLESKTYDGYKLKADITDGEHFTVKTNEGGTDADTYTVVLELRNPAYYMWKGQTLANRTAETSVDFVINKAPNGWSVAPNVIAWEYKGYSLNTNLILGAATGGSVAFRITTDEKGENVYSGLDSLTLTEKDGIYVVSDEVAAILKDMPAGTYYLTATITPDSNHLETDALNVSFEVGQAVNGWNVSLGITTWVAGSYGELEEFPVTVEAKFGEVSVKLSDANDESKVFYEGLNGTDDMKAALAGLGAGRYVLTATVAEVSDFGGVNDFIIFSVFAPEGLAWWAVLIIVVGALGIAALILFVLHQRGVLQMLTGRFVIAMRTKMSVDATIAAVRANKRAEEAKVSIAEAEARDAEEARRKEIEAAKARPIEEQAEDLYAKAQTTAEMAEKIQKRAEEMKEKATKMKSNASKSGEAAEADQTVEQNASEELKTTDDDSDEK